MVQINITKMSSKGQVVIPREMRKNIKEGEKIVIIQNGNQLILKKAGDFDNNIKEDLEFAKRTEEAFRRYEKGEFIEMNFDNFLKEVKKW